MSGCNSRALAWSWQEEGGSLQLPEEAAACAQGCRSLWSSATGPVSVTGAQDGTTPVPPWLTLVLHLYSWAGAHLLSIYLSFRSSKTKEFCFVQSSVARFVCGPILCKVCLGQLLLLLLVLAMGQGMARAWDHPKTLP